MSKPAVTIDVTPVVESAIGGGLEGAERTSRETATWTPSMLSPDQAINPVKPMADARAQDMVQNDGYASGAATLHKDNIVGSQYMLNARPNWRVLGVDESWAEEFQRVVEGRFNTLAESEDCWFDAARRNTFTGLIRLAIGKWVMTGEVLATAEWIKNDFRRPFKTAIQLISPARLSNPDGKADDWNLRRGVELDLFGRPTGYHIQAAHPSEFYSFDRFKWKFVPAEKPWGRKQVIHIIEQLLPSQSRGVADMVAVLKQMRMTKNFQDIVLQNAVVNATYAAAIESELPTAEVYAMLGAGTANPIDGMNAYLSNYLGALGTYLDGAKNIQIDGVKIPHLFPGTKLHMQPVGTPGGVGADFEQSLLRHIAACLGLSYEQFTRDYTKTNYSSARASMNETWKNMQAKKSGIADRLAKNIYSLWLEEEIAAGNIPLPPGKDRSWFYEPLVKDALTVCTWIGASRGQIDEMKETQAALLRIAGGLSTFERESARLGEDWRETFAQRAREQKVMDELGLVFSTDATKTAGPAASNGTLTGDEQDQQDKTDQQQ